MKPLYLALAQLRSHLGDIEHNLYRIHEAMIYASQKGADYILFPELYTTGYFLNERVNQLAEPIDGQIITRVRRYASELQVGTIIGFPEKDGQRIYNSAAFIDKQGELLGVYRKTHLFDHEKKYFSYGDQLPVFQVPEGKFGILITYDLEFPETARILTMKQAKMIFVLSANMIPYQTYQYIYLRARAIENQIYMATANKVGLENDSVFFGESEVINPDGTLIHKSLNNEEILIVPITFTESQQSKGVLDYMNNRRTELYKKEGFLNDDFFLKMKMQ